MKKSLLFALSVGIVNSLYGLDTVATNTRREKQPHWKAIQSHEAKCDAIAKAEAKRARKQYKKDKQ